VRRAACGAVGLAVELRIVSLGRRPVVIVARRRDRLARDRFRSIFHEAWWDDGLVTGRTRGGVILRDSHVGERNKVLNQDRTGQDMWG